MSPCYRQWSKTREGNRDLTTTTCGAQVIGIKGRRQERSNCIVGSKSTVLAYDLTKQYVQIPLAVRGHGMSQTQVLKHSLSSQGQDMCVSRCANHKRSLISLSTNFSVLLFFQRMNITTETADGKSFVSE